jgi:hypothetical protein
MKMKNILFIAIIQILTLFNCSKNNKTESKNDYEVVVSVHPQQMDAELLKEKILKEKDLNAYKNYILNQRNKPFNEEHIKLSEIIYEKYHSRIALMFIINSYFKKYNPDFIISLEGDEKYFKNIPKEDLYILLKYINIGVEKEYYACIQILSDYYKYLGDDKKAKELEESIEILIIENRKKVNDSLNNLKNKKD